MGRKTRAGAKPVTRTDNQQIIKNMKFNELADRESECTVVVHKIGSPTSHHLTGFEPLTEMKDFPLPNRSKKKFKENWYDLYAANTQFIYHKLGEPDEKSLEHQMKGNKMKLVKGRIDRSMAFVQFPIDYICAQVLSKVHDSISGKLEGVSFTYASNGLNFKAKWAFGRNKFVILTD